ncbi:MAG: GNAT family N-acetyltransferase [Planctomycetaceae bacterium]|nr:GNAT family N-acetyltransferase [Planctomycetaceae bacterium]MCA9019926.1 GNAT family N-acetyltransferase [Planctomycetaceae bacterium]
MQIEEKIEYDINPQLHDEITRLRNDCFPEHSTNRSYFKQLPHFRFLAYEEGLLVGQMGIDHRVISVGESVFSIFGVIDLCVSSSYRNRGIATALLEQLSALAREKGIDFLFLVADDYRLYEKNGFQPVSTSLTWLRIDEHKNYGVGMERIENELMIKQTGKKVWPDEPVDLLGYLF